MQKSSIIRTVIEILVFLVLLSVIIMFSAALAGVPVETVPSSAYSVGTLNENGKAEESETSIYTPEMYAVKGLDIEVKEKAERQGFNPLTKQPITIAASKAPVVKFGKAFKDLFNKLL